MLPLITFNLMQYFTVRVVNVSDIPRSIMKLTDEFPLFVVYIAFFFKFFVVVP